MLYATSKTYRILAAVEFINWHECFACRIPPTVNGSCKGSSNVIVGATIPACWQVTILRIDAAEMTRGRPLSVVKPFVVSRSHQRFFGIIEIYFAIEVIYANTQLTARENMAFFAQRRLSCSHESTAGVRHVSKCNRTIADDAR